ncbi:hypothetical protein Tco_0310582, partial [Tanacetum coccineum]
MGNGRGEPPHNKKTLIHFSTQYYDKHGVPPMKRLFKVAMLDPSPKFIGPWGTSRDPGQPRKNLDNGEWSRPSGFQFTRENIQSRVEKENTITNVDRSKSFRRPDHEVHSVHSVELSCDYPQFEYQ